MECEIFGGHVSRSAKRILGAMYAAAEQSGIRAVRTQTYKGNSPWFMTWGLGHLERRKWTDAHIRNGGNVIAWDLGYWNRLQRSRLTIDADHPHRLVRDMPHTRLPKIHLREDSDPNGPVIVVGMGRKSVAVFGDWEKDALRRVRKAYPDKKVILRPKGEQTPIESVLKGASLVVCRHSNVALDATIAGIPVVCEDGIAYSLYNSNIYNPVKPTVAQRLQLLANAGWWQWAPNEAKEAWRHIKSHIP